MGKISREKTNINRRRRRRRKFSTEMCMHIEWTAERKRKNILWYTTDFYSCTNRL